MDKDKLRRSHVTKLIETHAFLSKKLMASDHAHWSPILSLVSTSKAISGPLAVNRTLSFGSVQLANR